MCKEFIKTKGGVLLLRLGTAKVDITPIHPVPLAGFGFRQGNFRTKCQSLFARVYCFEERISNAVHRRALFISADILWWGPDRLKELIREIKRVWEVPTDRIILHATHNHSGPQTGNQFPFLGQVDEGYLAYMEGELLQGIASAVASLEVVALERGEGSLKLGVFRRKHDTDGVISMAPNPEGPVDPEVSVIRFRTLEGRTKGIWVHYTCHPTTTGDQDVSSEYCGVAMEQLERSMGGGTVCAFLQGCCGDIRPELVNEGKFYRGGPSEVDLLARKLSKEVEAVLACGMRSISFNGLRLDRTEFFLPYHSKPDLLNEQHPGDWVELMHREPWRMQEDGKLLEVYHFKFSDDLSLVAMNAEMVVEYGLYIKRITKSTAIPLSYSNGMIGYIATEQQIKEGGYEGKDFIYPFGLPAAYNPDIESKIREVVDTLLMRAKHV